MRTLLAGWLLAGAALALSGGVVHAEGWELPKLPSFSNSNSNSNAEESPQSKSAVASAAASATKTVKQLNAGTKRLVRGTVDVVTLRPLWDNNKLDPPAKPWLNNSEKTTKKKSSGWGSWFAAKDDSRPQTVQDFVGMKRPN